MPTEEDFILSPGDLQSIYAAQVGAASNESLRGRSAGAGGGSITGTSVDGSSVGSFRLHAFNLSDQGIIVESNFTNNTFRGGIGFLQQEIPPNDNPGGGDDPLHPPGGGGPPPSDNNGGGSGGGDNGGTGPGGGDPPGGDNFIGEDPFFQTDYFNSRNQSPGDGEVNSILTYLSGIGWPWPPVVPFRGARDHFKFLSTLSQFSQCYAQLQAILNGVLTLKEDVELNFRLSDSTHQSINYIRNQIKFMEELRRKDTSYLSWY
jgi:hypothetical protein